MRTREPGKNPATRTFQALRMHINDELGQIRRALEASLELLSVGGRLAVISFHSLEDRLVKQFIQAHSTVDPVFAGLPVIPESAQPRLARVGSKIRAGEAELAANPRARSSVLRVAAEGALMRAPSNKLLILAIPLLWAAALASAAGAIYSKHRARELFVELERLNVKRDNLEIEWGQLQLEQSAWSTHAFVENVAGTKLKMGMPPPKDIELVSP